MAKMGGFFPLNFISLRRNIVPNRKKKGLRVMAFFVKSSWNKNDRSRVNEQTENESDIFFFHF